MLRRILRGTDVEAVTLAELGILREAEEDGGTTQSNAEKKARHYHALSGLPTFSLDGGLHIDRLTPEMQPGAAVKRAAGANILDYYLRQIEDVGGESFATWTGSQALALPGGQVLLDTFTFRALFTTHSKGDVVPGLALDSIMIDPASGRYYTELAPEERPYYQPTARFILSHLHRIAAAR